AIQHNEAVNLACEHIGIQRTRTDAYFDGTLGKSLVKIIPFGHPLTPLDLEELKRELDARPDEDRPITLVCLGMELAAKAAVNRITVIELRTDPKYGKFIKHEPARARVTIVRKDDKLVIEIEDFIAPTIIERLQQQAGLLQPKIDDWRAMVDCVMIDPDYDGHVFKVALSDIPERKSDFVSGRYELPAPSDKTTVAVKVIDMLGEEVLVSQIV
ncbi:MAG: restriction endonuclease subunit M, partial [Nitrospiraceae bacterium]